MNILRFFNGIALLFTSITLIFSLYNVCKYVSMRKNKKPTILLFYLMVFFRLGSGCVLYVLTIITPNSEIERYSNLTQHLVEATDTDALGIFI